jgi:predicted MPP superfamily phosphohydrolase
MASFSPAQLLGAGIAVTAGVLAYSTLVERNAFTLRRVTVPVLKSGSDDIRVLHISDLHIAPWQKSKIQWVAALAQLQPDVVVDTGDNLGHVRALPALRAALNVFAGTPGVYVNGSNDYFAPEFKNPFGYLAGPSQQYREPLRLDTKSLQTFLSGELGWQNLNNRASLLTIGDHTLEFFGTDDPHREFDSLDEMSRSLDAIRARSTSPSPSPSPSADKVLSIGVTHAPYRRVVDSLVDHGARVVFAGHTHGGQVCVPGFGALVTNCDLPRKMAKGLSPWITTTRSGASRESNYLHVSAGLGTSIYAPVRFACPPEATLLTLTSAS